MIANENPILDIILRGFSKVGLAPQKFLPVTRTVDGFEWQFSYYSSWFRSEHESSLRRLILEKGGDYFFDVGANVGGWSLRATQHFAEVYAFEPHPKTGAILRRNIEKNRARIGQNHSQVRLFPCALGNQNGKLTFYSDRKGDRGNGGASLTMMNPGHPYEARKRTTVEVRRLDDLHLPCTDKSLVKIDVEGSEVPALEGMEGTLRERHPLLFLEAHGQENIVRCKELLGELGYTISEVPLRGQSYLFANGDLQDMTRKLKLRNDS